LQELPYLLYSHGSLLLIYLQVHNFVFLNACIVMSLPLIDHTIRFTIPFYP
jgi:hypothetical protein